MQEVDTGALKDWELLKVEGETEKVPVVEAPLAAKGKTPAKQTVSVTQEVDNLARHTRHKKDFASDNGDRGLFMFIPCLRQMLSKELLVRVYD
jgi:hypothetical protein